MSWRRVSRLTVLTLIALLPSLLKKPLYRLLFGYRFEEGVHIGLALLDARKVELAKGTRIGHCNVILRVDEFSTGPHVRVGFLNVIRGGERVHLADYSTVLRLNVLNAIPEHDCTSDPRSELELGPGSIIVSGHRIDFTDRVKLGCNVIVGGRNSSLWTHNRQETSPIVIGDFCYLGSEVRLAPGARLPHECILALGSVLAGSVDTPRSLVAGVPARVVRPLNGKDLERIRRKTRGDMPDDYYDRREP